MTIWNLHLLNARNELTPVLAEIRAIAREVVALVGAHLDLPRFDLIVRAGDAVIPEWGIGGHAPAAGVIELVLDPARVAPDHFRRTLVHEMHHLARWDGPGYGRSLGEALVSEGLAGHFVLQVLGGAPDPWDAARPGPGSLKQASALWARRDYDHGEWFMGRGRMRKWTGYGLGHLLVAEYLAQAPEEDAAALVWSPADAFRPALRRLMAAQGVEAPDEVNDLGAEGEGRVEAADGDQIASRDAGGPAPRTPRDI